MTPATHLRVSQEASDAMCASATGALPKETGGILLGFRTGEGVYVTGALEVADGRATSVSYRRSHRKATNQLAAVLALEPEGSPVGYVGEWHSHPAPQPPSRQDMVAIGATALAAGDDIVLVVLRRIAHEWRITVTEARRATGRSKASSDRRKSRSSRADASPEALASDSS